MTFNDSQWQFCNDYSAIQQLSNDYSAIQQLSNDYSAIQQFSKFRSFAELLKRHQHCLKCHKVIPDTDKSNDIAYRHFQGVFWFRSAVQLQKHDVRKRGNFETYLYKLPSKIVSNPIRSQTDFQNFAWKTWKIVGDDTQNSPHDYEYICFISRFFVFKQNYRNLQFQVIIEYWILLVTGRQYSCTVH
jgi:hypothetical protein